MNYALLGLIRPQQIEHKIKSFGRDIMGFFSFSPKLWLVLFERALFGEMEAA